MPIWCSKSRSNSSRAENICANARICYAQVGVFVLKSLHYDVNEV